MMDKHDYPKRLLRMEEQAWGLQRLIEADAYCIDVLTQISAVTKSPEHADAMIEEATRAIERLVRA